MILGLSGAHATGKTTLAKAFSEKNGMPFVHFETREVMRDAGISSTDIRNIADRMRVQRLIVERCDKVFLRNRSPIVTDRTPIDVAAYTMADMIQCHDGNKAVQDEAQSIVRDCIDITNCSFKAIVTLPPAIPYVAEPGRPAPNLAYQEHIHLLALGLMSDTRFARPYFIITPEVVDLESRVEVLENIWEAIIEEDVYASELATMN